MHKSQARYVGRMTDPKKQDPKKDRLTARVTQALKVRVDVASARLRETEQEFIIKAVEARLKELRS